MSSSAELVAALAGRRVVALTGAGVSTASGIGDYRDEQGEWKRPAPVQMQDFVRHASARRRYWMRSMHGWPLMSAARPNEAHLALAALERAGVVQGVITQNVDGLHQQAGQAQLIELHGALREVSCLACGERGDRAALQRRLERDNPGFLHVAAAAAPDGDADLAAAVDLDEFRVPDCGACGGCLKPDVVFYGDSVPRQRVARAVEWVAAADVLLLVGSSLMVFSAFRFCRLAKQQGIPMVAINRGVTRADEWLDLKVQEDCADTLAALAAALVSQ